MQFENFGSAVHRFRSLRMVSFAVLLVAFAAQALAAQKVVVISLDGCKPAIVQQLLAKGVLSPNQGLGLLLSRGAFASGSMTVTPSLTASNHIALATGSTGAHNDVAANTFHLVASPFLSTISGFGAPIGGYQFSPLGPDPTPTAEPLWVALRNSGKTVVTATWPGGDGIDVFVPGVSGSPIVQPNSLRTVDYTVPFGAFAGLGGKGFVLTASNFSPAAASTISGLTAAGKVSFSPILEAPLETFTVSGVAYSIQVAALDTTNDNTTNYDMLAFFDLNHGGITPGPFALPSTGPAYVKNDGTSQQFFLEGSPSKAGTAFFVTQLAPDLSTVHIARYSANAIPRNVQPGVLANVDDINNNVGYWTNQADFRFPERINPGLTSFSDLELEAIYEDQVQHFVDYQTRLALRAMSQSPNADLTMIYIEQPDGSEHQFLLIDPRQATNPTDPNSIGAAQDPAKIARYQKYIEFAYQTADQAVQRIINAVGVDGQGLPLANIIVVSDHGFAPFHTAVSINNLLAANGIDPTEARALTSGPAANIYINLQGREPNGTVSKQEYLQLQAKIQKILSSFRDTNANYAPSGPVPVFEQVFVRPTPGGVNDPNFGLDTSTFIGQDFGDVFALMTIGYNFDGTQSPAVQRKGDTPSTAPVLSVPNFYGAHGHNSSQGAMFGFFAAAGPDIRRGLIKSPVRVTDLAPTVEKFFGVTPSATVNGRALKIFKK